MMRAALIAALLASAGCGPNDGPGAAPADRTPGGRAEEGAEPAPAPANGPGAVARDRPRVREDTILLEGMPEVERATLVRPPADFAVPFSTYVPDGMRTEFTSPDAVRFSAAFGGVANPDAYVHVRIHESGAPQPDVRDVARNATLASTALQATETPSWALSAVRFSYRTGAGVRIAGRAMTAEHAGRYFHVVVHYPEEYGDGMGPRVDRILRHWRWDDTGEPLMR